MTYKNLTDEVARLYPNEYTASEMMSWAREVNADVTKNIEKREAQPARVSESDTVLIPAPYDDMYRYYILAQIAFYQRDYAAYNQYISLYGARRSDYAAYYQRTYGSEGVNFGRWIT